MTLGSCRNVVMSAFFMFLSACGDNWIVPEVDLPCDCDYETVVVVEPPEVVDSGVFVVDAGTPFCADAGIAPPTKQCKTGYVLKKGKCHKPSCRSLGHHKDHN